MLLYIGVYKLLYRAYYTHDMVNIVTFHQMNVCLIT